MMKIKTEDCVRVLEEKFGSRYSWKRISKFKDGNGIVRIFKDRLTGSLSHIYEENGEIKDVSLGDYTRKNVVVVKNENPVYYVLHKSEGFIGVSVTEGKYFDKNGCQSDWTPDEIFEELERLGYPGSEMMEGMIEFHNEVEDIEDLKAKLASSPVFKFSPAFQDFLGSVCDESDEDNEEFRVIRI